MGFAADVRDADAVADSLRSTHEAWGPIDVLISGAAGNFVAPAAELSANGFAAVEAWTTAVPLRRLGESDDIWKAVSWLVSDEAAYVTGVVLSVDGGLSLGGSSALTRAITT